MVDVDAHKKAQESLDSVLAGARRQLVEEHTEVDEFLANESGTLFTDEQLTFFRRAKKIYREQRKRGLF